MERFSDLYGFSGLDLEAARTCLEEALNIRLTAHESLYRGGDYYSLDEPGTDL